MTNAPTLTRATLLPLVVPSLPPEELEAIQAAPAGSIVPTQLPTPTVIAVAPPPRPTVAIPPSLERAMLQMCVARIAMRAGFKVLAHHMEPGTRQGHLTGPWLVTVNVPEAGQLAFEFSEEEGALLAGIPRCTPFPVDFKDLLTHDYESLVRGMLKLCPEALKVAEESPWNGQDGSPASHHRLISGL